ncbi:MAG TPA: translation initiation factor IF-1 [Candidatus Paceibacterota bacterium]
MDHDTEDVKDEIVLGVVEEALPNALFRVKIDTSDQLVLAYLSGRMRKFRIRVLVGDTVGMIMDPYGGKARITKRI